MPSSKKDKKPERKERSTKSAFKPPLNLKSTSKVNSKMKSAPVQRTKNYVENLPFSPPSSDTGCSPLVFSASSPNTSIGASKDAGCSPLAFSSLSPNSSIGASCSPPAFGCSSPLASTSIGASKDVGCSPLAFGSSSPVPSTSIGASKNIGCSTLAFGSSSPNTSIGASKDIASSSERKRSGSSLIGYVRQVSPSKRNKRDTLDYFEVILQTEDSDRQRAVCYEKAKRPLFLSGQESKTPVKLTNFTTSDRNGDIFVNNITRVSQAEPGEYCFQYKEVRQSSGELNISVKQILETCRAMDVVDVTAKVLKKNLLRTVGKNNLQLVEAVINDGTASIQLDVWEDHISTVEEGKVYTFCKARVREWNKNLTLSLSKESKVQLVDKANTNFDPDTCHDDSAFALGENCIDVSSIISIENITEFIQCINCNKKIVQVSGQLVVFCDKCGHRMKRDKCKRNIITNFVAEISSQDSESKTLRLTVFRELLLKMCPAVNKADVTVDNISHALLSLQNFKVQFNRDQIVTEVNLGND